MFIWQHLLPQQERNPIDPPNCALELRTIKELLEFSTTNHKDYTIHIVLEQKDLEPSYEDELIELPSIKREPSAKKNKVIIKKEIKKEIEKEIKKESKKESKKKSSKKNSRRLNQTNQSYEFEQIKNTPSTHLLLITRRSQDAAARCHFPTVISLDSDSSSPDDEEDEDKDVKPATRYLAGY
ncbi:hypothetical protein GJ744_011050 [Endocarpon pusillum]|uniref:Uncharacterized protein n=1 Tax=Endocarpon pusillum TaxID=364733 RepID=A0A8H7E531_9EURO|nr:hypothetical protein GJ744_011050 [Endocarpon pusillum]